MMRSRVGWVMMVASLLALWGCSQNGSGAGQAKTNRLQEEIQGLTAMRDQLRQDLNGAKEQKARLQAQLDQLRQEHLDLTKERDDLRQNLAARVAERDHTQAQLEQLRKGVRALMEQADAMVPAERATNTSAQAD